MPEAANELVVIVKFCDLLIWSAKHIDAGFVQFRNVVIQEFKRAPTVILRSPVAVVMRPNGTFPAMPPVVPLPVLLIFKSGIGNSGG